MATRKSELVITCNAKAVKDVFEYLNRQLADVKQKLKDLNAKGEKSGWTEQMKKDFRDLTKQATAIDSAIIHNQQSMVKYGQVLKDLSGSKLKDLKTALREATTSLNKMSEKSPGRQKLIDDIKRIKDQISGTSGLTMSFRQAQTQLKNLDNTSMDKLKQGLASIKAQLDNPNIGNKWRRSLEQMQAQYQAAMAVRTAPSGVMPVSQMNAQQLGAERTALMSAIAATSGVKGYESKTAGMETRLKAVNEQLKVLTENEKKATAEAKRLQETQQAAQTVRAVYRGQTVSLEELNKAYATLEARAKQFAGVNPAKAKAATQQMTRLRQEILEVTRAMNGEIRIDKQFLKNATNEQLQNALTRLQQKMQQLSSTQGRAAAKIKQDMAAIEKQIKNNTGAIQKQGNTFGTAIKNIAAYVGVFGAFNMIKSKITEVYKSNLKLSDSLADIRKVSGLTSEEINKLYTNISKIDTRNTIETLNKLAYTGAKLGIGQNYGVEGLTGFVRAAEQVQMALGEDLGEEALPALAKLTEVMNLIPRYGVEQAMQKSASAIFQLGATSTATGKNIVEFSKRLMGLANVSRVSADELLAIGSAADAMGLMPEVAATAFNKLFTSIQKGHNLIEKSLGLVKGSINENFSKGQTMKSIVDIFEAMNKRGNMNALDGIFKDLGSDGARLVAVMTTMADRVDILKKHLETSTKAFKDGTAVINEYMIQNETAQALMQRASNLWAKAFTNPEGVDMVKQLAEKWYEVSKALTQSESSMYVFHSTLEKITNTIIQIVQILPFLIKMLTWLGIFGGIRMLVNSFIALTTAINAARTATATLQVVMNSNWVLAGLAAVAGGISLFIDNLNAAAEKAEMMRKRQEALDLQLEKSKEKINSVAAPMESYKKALDQSNKSLDERNRLMKDLLKSDYQQYLDYLGIEIDGAYDLATAYAQVVKVLKQKKAYEEREQYRDEVNSTNKYDRMRAGMQFGQAAKAIGAGNIDQEWLRRKLVVNQSTETIINDIVKAAGGSSKTIDLKNGLQGIVLRDKNGNFIDSNALERLRNTINAYNTARVAENAGNKMVDDAYKNDVGDFDMEKFQEEVLKAQLKRKGSLEKEKPDKDALAAAKKEAQERKKALKLEMDEAQKDSTAVINAIEEFYRLQESAVEQLVADGKMTREEADKLIDYVKSRKDLMLMNARRAIAGKDSDFENLRKTMGQDMLRPDDQNSQRAMNTVQTIDVAKAAQRLQKFDGSKAVYDLNAGSFTQAMLKNAAQNELNIQRRQASVQTEIDKLLLQYQYVEQAQRDFGNKLVKMGLITDGYQKVVQQLADGTEIVANTNEVQGFANKVVGLGSSLYAVNPEDSASLQKLMYDVMTTKDKNGMPAMESFASIFPNFDQWMEQPEQYKAEMQAMYELMIQYEGIYYDKLKQRDDLQNKRLGSWWEHSDQKKENDQKLRDIDLYEYQYDTMHEGDTMGFMMGLTNDLTHDPEVMREQAVLEQKIAIWKKAKEEREANLISEEVYQQKLRDMQDQTMTYSKKVMENINQRISRIQAFVKPVETAANTIGKKLGDMIFNMQSEESTWEQIWKNMALAMAESLLTMVGQYAQYQIQKAAINKAEVLDEATKAQAITMLGISSGAAKTIGTLGWWGIALIPVITSLLMGLLTSALSTANDSTNANTNTGKNTKLVSGMLTYDKGNVQRFIGQDGRVYTATEEPQPKDGLVTHPIATTVQGQPALVAERGPEIVIGRETTQAIMMNEPQLIKYLADYGKTGGFAGGWRPYDSGNVSEVSAISPQPSDINGMTDADARALIAAIGTFNQTVQQMQQKGIPCYINKYGRGGLIDEVQSGLKFENRYKG